MKIVRALLMILLVVAVFVAGFGYGRWYGKNAGGAAQKGGRKILYYVDPMHPAYKSDKPGIAPDCGMKLEPVYAGGEETSSPPATDEKASMPMGTIKISPEKQQLIGVRYGEVESGAGVHTFRAVGKVAFDETRIARVHARVEGWIDQVFVDFTGQVVNKGQRLLTLYSPEMLATQQEYLLALKSKDMLKNSTLEDAVRQSDSLTAASRKRLELWDLSDAQIEEIARTGKPVTNITLNSPISGYVITRNAFPKQRITPETELYNIVDLSRVWIMADVFENEASMVRLDQQATVSLAYGRGRSFRAKVNYIQPQVDPMTRTLKVRLEAENPEILLKPDMYADVEFRVGTPRRITVPSEAVLNSGERKTVFVDRGNGYIEPRDVEIGERIGDRLEILKGLKPGERIVISGNFLIDSESQLKAAAGGMAGMPGMPGMPEPAPKSSGSKPPAQPTQESMPGMPGMPATPEPKK
jgi:Cu(I)/Ag(I) efflux system membrane fusion protein